MSRSAGGICAKPQLGDRAASQGSVSNRPRIAVGKPSLQSTAAVSRTYLSKLEMAATYPGLEIIAKLATVLELASWGLRCLPGTASDWERSAALYPINQPRFAAGQ